VIKTESTSGGKEPQENRPEQTPQADGPDIELGPVRPTDVQITSPALSIRSTSETSSSPANKKSYRSKKSRGDGSSSNAVDGRTSPFDRTAAFVFRIQHRLHAESDPVLCKVGGEEVVKNKAQSQEVLDGRRKTTAVTRGARSLGCGVYEIDADGKLAYIVGADECWL
jgi:hypothetical protein